jgi:DNA-binding protein H-NS
MAREPKTTASDLMAALDALSVADLRTVIATAERLVEAKQESEKQDLLAEFRSKAEALGLTVEELVGVTERPARGRPRQSSRGIARRPVAAKYRNPETGATWSGRGRAPRWLAAAEAKGKKREDFAIGGGSR